MTINNQESQDKNVSKAVKSVIDLNSSLSETNISKSNPADHLAEVLYKSINEVSQNRQNKWELSGLEIEIMKLEQFFPSDFTISDMKKSLEKKKQQLDLINKKTTDKTLIDELFRSQNSQILELEPELERIAEYFSNNLTISDIKSALEETKRELNISTMNLNSRDLIEKAIQNYQSALEIFSMNNSPLQWANVMVSLGAVYAKRIEGKQSENLTRAIFYYEQALEVYTRDTYPEKWASIKVELGNIYSRLQDEIKSGTPSAPSKLKRLLSQQNEASPLIRLPKSNSSSTSLLTELSDGIPLASEIDHSGSSYTNLIKRLFDRLVGDPSTDAPSPSKRKKTKGK